MKRLTSWLNFWMGASWRRKEGKEEEDGWVAREGRKRKEVHKDAQNMQFASKLLVVLDGEMRETRYDMDG